ncbi:GIY-YIG nuclease family protein [Streptomyces sp. HNM0663]|uniref:GIY-YIG nuclease family protein n=1 Tax=Streptomyces chengmaiensis TaxID=3040919 RepID=A0ABT6HYY2_9ACTN|nr:GIY-YIG nuclease family protein [Streptomyces chengmaiensis]MDH2393922.1 GIY-YIG nuclease family protein [Streptomyces chengmaiensis]
MKTAGPNPELPRIAVGVATNVYAIAAIGTSMVKIGASSNPAGRVTAFQIGCPLELRLLGNWWGGSLVENYLHHAFATKRVRGEWFDFKDEDPLPLIEATVEKAVRYIARQPPKMIRC